MTPTHCTVDILPGQFDERLLKLKTPVNGLNRAFIPRLARINQQLAIVGYGQEQPPLRLSGYF